MEQSNLAGKDQVNSRAGGEEQGLGHRSSSGSGHPVAKEGSMLVKRQQYSMGTGGYTAPCPVWGRGTAMPPTGREGHRQVSAGLRGPQVGGPWLVKGHRIPIERIRWAWSVMGEAGLDGPPPAALRIDIADARVSAWYTP
jgi:hypothetical protein